MFPQRLQVVCHVLLELADALGAESVGDCLSFAGMLGAVAGVEEASLNRDECVVVVAVKARLCELLFIRICGKD